MSIATEEELASMRAAGVVARLVLESMKRAVRPSITTAELDAIGNKVMQENGAQSAPAMVYRFPGGSCISVNDEVVHGIPNNRMLAEGDLVKLDVTIEKNGFMADTAVTVAVGAISRERRKLLECVERAFAKAMLVARAGFRVFEIGRIVEREVRRDGFALVRDLCGHGIGRTIHESPQVPNYADPRGQVLAHRGPGHLRRAHHRRRNRSAISRCGRLDGAHRRSHARCPLRTHYRDYQGHANSADQHDGWYRDPKPLLTIP